ncbi:VOC family protein [Saxibacter everestensis]|uniref:VOC family protein n=1 Tax=Saxibacter everestensis TaxID=2909229 RepID=A0ABY8QTB8_9MICO|nr:VOC family protein [Brevibacteriaceae bacterium ZFBP1038]
MEQKAHFVTVATSDLDEAREFYVTGLGWLPTLDVPGEIIFFQVGHGLMLGLFDARKFAADLNVSGSAATASAPNPSGFTLSHNVDSPAAVDKVMADAATAGATILKTAQPADFGGYHGHFADPNGAVWEVAHNPAWRVEDDGTVVLGTPND